jgi:hypothetical protein
LYYLHYAGQQLLVAAGLPRYNGFKGDRKMESPDMAMDLIMKNLPAFLSAFRKSEGDLKRAYQILAAERPDLPPKIDYERFAAAAPLIAAMTKAVSLDPDELREALDGEE